VPGFLKLQFYDGYGQDTKSESMIGQEKKELCFCGFSKYKSVEICLEI
jgi:hypothetical protein